MSTLPFLEARLDPRVTAGASSTISVPGRIKRYGPTGQLLQNFIATRQVLKFDVTHGIRTAEQFNEVQDAFYVVMFTPYEGLRFKNWGDYRATLANSAATLLEGSSTLLQLQRLHAFGSVQYLRPIMKPVAGTVTVYRTRSGVTAAIASSTDPATGISTISGHAGGDSYSWTGEFDIPVTFSDDEWTAELTNGANDVLVSGSIRLEEIRLDEVTS